jgi:hypothetical protein
LALLVTSDQAQELPFANADLQKIAKEVIETVIGISQFQANQVAEWSHAISSQILEKLTQNSNQCKYIGRYGKLIFRHCVEIL